jgi:hypothetical protein
MRTRVRARWRSWLCWLFHGSHDLYVVRTRGQIFEQCLRCGYATPGWKLEADP